MSYSQDKLDEIHDELVDINYDDPAWKYAMAVMEDELNFNILDLLKEKNQQKLLQYIQKQIKMALEDLRAIDDMAIQDGINRVREIEELGDDVSDDEIRNKYEDEVYKYAEGSQYVFEEDFSDNWEELVKVVGDFRDEYELEWKLKRIDDEVIETINKVEEVYQELTKEAFIEVFNE